jgi:hypothetical protein
MSDYDVFERWNMNPEMPHATGAMSSRGIKSAM